MWNAAGRKVTFHRSDFLACEKCTQFLFCMSGKELPQIFPAFTVIHVSTQESFDGFRHFLRSAAISDGTAKAGKLAYSASQAEIVRILKTAIYFDLFAFQANVSDAMLAATVRASGDVEFELLIESWKAIFQLLHQPASECFGLSDGELAELRSGAGHRTAPES
jgi:hypothetical protein